MDLQSVKDNIVTNIYHIDSAKKVALHKHDKHDKVFYCIKGSGFGILEDQELELTIGKTFIAPAGKMHSMRTDDNIYLTSFLVPVVE